MLYKEIDRILSHDISSASNIQPCIKINKPLVFCNDM